MAEKLNGHKRIPDGVWVFLSSVFFALGGLLFKIISWDALAISSARSILAGTVILVFLLIRRHHFVLNRHVILAALSISATNTLYAIANKLTTAGNTIVLQFTMPVFVILIMAVCYRKRPGRMECIVCLLVLAGILCFFIDSLSAGNMTGNLLALASGVCYAGFFIFNSREDSEPFTAILLSYGLTAMIGLPSLLKTEIAASPAGEIAAVLALGIVQQAVAQLCFATGIRGTGAVAAGLISGLEPILNPVLVALFAGESLTPLSMVGAVTVVATVVIYDLLNSRKQSADEKQNGTAADTEAAPGH